MPHPPAPIAPQIDLQPGLKVFPAADILSLAAGFSFSSPARLHALVAFITGTDAGDAAAHAKDARQCLEEQFPFLKDMDYTTLHRAFAQGEDHVRLWLEAQVQKYGDEHAVMPLARWQRRRNSHKL